MAYVTRDGVRLHYSVSGTGPAVLWHTGGCGDGTMWETAGYLSALPGYRHVLLDHRGHGRSDCPPDIASQPMSEYVADVIAVLDAAGLERSAIVGYSQGARIAYATAIDHPERVSAVVGIDSIPALGDETEALRAGAERVQRLGTRAVIEAMAGGEAEAPPAWLVAHLCGTGTDAFAGAYEAFATMGDFWGALPTLATPMLFLVGIDEPGDEFDRRAAKAAELLAFGRAVSMPGLGHLQAFWRTDVTIAPLSEFLAQYGSG